MLAGLEHGRLGQALAGLSPELRGALEATVLDGLTCAEAAVLLGVMRGMPLALSAHVDAGRLARNRSALLVRAVCALAVALVPVTGAAFVLPGPGWLPARRPSSPPPRQAGCGRRTSVTNARICPGVALIAAQPPVPSLTWPAC